LSEQFFVVTIDSCPYTFSYGSDFHLLFLVQLPNGQKTKRLIGGGAPIDFDDAYKRAETYATYLHGNYQSC
jgi:hypothetical protein